MVRYFAERFDSISSHKGSEKYGPPVDHTLGEVLVPCNAGVDCMPLQALVHQLFGNQERTKHVAVHFYYADDTGPFSYDAVFEELARRWRGTSSYFTHVHSSVFIKRGFASPALRGNQMRKADDDLDDYWRDDDDTTDAVNNGLNGTGRWMERSCTQYAPECTGDGSFPPFGSASGDGDSAQPRKLRYCFRCILSSLHRSPISSPLCSRFHCPFSLLHGC